MPITYDMEESTATDIFEFQHGDMIYKDAIHMPLVEYNALSAEEVAAIKQDRFNNWLAIIQPLLEE